jgi:hypothetical protein
MKQLKAITMHYFIVSTWVPELRSISRSAFISETPGKYMPCLSPLRGYLSSLTVVFFFIFQASKGRPSNSHRALL